MQKPPAPVLIILIIGLLLTLVGWVPMTFSDWPQSAGPGQTVIALVTLPLGPACLALGFGVWFAFWPRRIAAATGLILAFTVVAAFVVGQGAIFVIRDGLPTLAAILIAVSTTGGGKSGQAAK